MRLRLIASVVFVFLLLSSLEAWAGFWLAGRWFASSRYATITLGTVKRWLDRGLITRTTNQVKIFVNRNGKWIILTVGLSTILPEVLRKIESARYCYEVSGFNYLHLKPTRNPPIYFTDLYSEKDRNLFQLNYACSGYSTSTDIVSVAIRHYLIYDVVTYAPYRDYVGRIPQPGTYTLTSRDGKMTCTVDISMTYDMRPCSSSQSQTWENEKRDAPVRIYPNPLDFIRPDIVESDPVLRYLRDEYYRIARDTSIPDVSSDLVGLSLPNIGWNIPPEEAIDSDAESSEGSKPSTGTGSTDKPNDTPKDEDTPEDIPAPTGFDTSLPSLERKSFPVEVINSLVQNHPLLRILESVSLDVAGGGSCVMGSEPFIVDVCQWQWVLNLMGSFLVPLAFLYGLLGIGGRSEE